ncbi:MAG TPA: methyltransferase domain-containing protein, partial [Anaerolineae bacterium]|nr:methyltransferase domain-containing protein [Anaerolineae bacterium]
MVPLTLPLVDFLLSAAAQVALDELADQDLGEQASLDLLTRLRRTWPAEQAAALLDQARLRRKAGDKFPHPERLLFTDDALQQASSRAVAAYRAQAFVKALDRSPLPAPHSFYRVADLGCGLGADTIALAQAGLHVLAVERDPVRARMAVENLAVLGLAWQVRVVCADWRRLWPDFPQIGSDGAPWQDIRAAFIDPSRRAGEQRIFRLDAMEPP